MKEALCYQKLAADQVHCFLCAQHCRIKPGDRGKCGVRENRDGTLWSLVYGKLLAQNVDPIEKKPLYHFYPGTLSYSIATAGCNFHCRFCQNADISQISRAQLHLPGQNVPANRIVEAAKSRQSTSIAYTYTEPTIFLEYALEVARQAQPRGIKNVFVSNGFMTEQALATIVPYLDAANVDLKSFRNTFYVEQCGARLAPVLKTLERMKKAGIWLEVTTLVIPGLNDDPQELKELAEFLVTLGADIPWHLSRFHPTYQLTDRPPTPVQTLHRAREIGIEAGLHYVYTGNVPGDKGENTYCHQCGTPLIERFGFSIRSQELSNGRCARCQAPLAGVGF